MVLAEPPAIHFDYLTRIIHGVDPRAPLTEIAGIQPGQSAWQEDLEFLAATFVAMTTVLALSPTAFSAAGDQSVRLRTDRDATRIVS